ncbi:hypothetical protein C0J45_15311 [Silurus meridionalis]|nr:hypothetical protein C0J45_15311 [Silurus meridionalis]
MIPSILLISARMLAFMCLLMSCSGYLILHEGEKCGENKEGACESGLICVPSEPPMDFYAEGICTKESGCPNATCPEIPAPPCPADSFISEPHIEPGQCCPVIPAVCTCNFQTCDPKPTYCPNRGLPKLIVKGNGHPGTCCDRYECVNE